MGEYLLQGKSKGCSWRMPNLCERSVIVFVKRGSKGGGEKRWREDGDRCEIMRTRSPNSLIAPRWESEMKQHVYRTYVCMQRIQPHSTLSTPYLEATILYLLLVRGMPRFATQSICSKQGSLWWHTGIILLAWCKFMMHRWIPCVTRGSETIRSWYWYACLCRNKIKPILNDDAHMVDSVFEVLDDMQRT